MLRHVQNASSVDEAADPLKEKDGRPAMIDRAPWSCFGKMESTSCMKQEDLHAPDTLYERVSG